MEMGGRKSEKGDRLAKVWTESPAPGPGPGPAAWEWRRKRDLFVAMSVRAARGQEQDREANQRRGRKKGQKRNRTYHHFIVLKKLYFEKIACETGRRGGETAASWPKKGHRLDICRAACRLPLHLRALARPTLWRHRICGGCAPIRVGTSAFPSIRDLCRNFGRMQS